MGADDLLRFAEGGGRAHAPPDAGAAARLGRTTDRAAAVRRARAVPVRPRAAWWASGTRWSRTISASSRRPGCVESEKRGRWTVYRARPEPLTHLARRLAGMAAPRTSHDSRAA